MTTLLVGQAHGASDVVPSAVVKNGNLTYSGYSYEPGAEGTAILVHAPRSTVPASTWLVEGYALSPKYSPDGTEIVYLVVDPNEDSWLVVRNATTGTTTRVIPVPIDVALASDGLDWSPDGNRFLLTDLHSLYVLDAATGEATTIFSKPGQIRSPAWSPDGTQIAFVRVDSIKLISPDGTGLRNFTSTPGGTNQVPDWSPDSSTIAFTTSRFGVHELVTLPRSGAGSVRRVSRLAGQAPARFYITDIAWSPDGQKMAALETEDVEDLYWARYRVYAADGSNKSWLTGRIDADGLTHGLHWGRRVVQ